VFNVGVGYIDGAIILEMSNKDNIEEEGVRNYLPFFMEIWLFGK
jgi:hypothetical protein